MWLNALHIGISRYTALYDRLVYACWLTDHRILAGDHKIADKVRTTCFAYLAACLA